MEKYRPDIDGLRAVAVLSVVFYHAGIKAMGGGYVGVDIFFVISGYLITRYIDQRIGEGKFSIVEFYERRVRRIMPALLFFLAVASALCYWGLLPDDLDKFAKSEIAAILFAPNIYFYRAAGYFDLAAKSKPLLHLWSLGVEEQFYIFFPLTMMIASRWGRRAILITVYAGFFVSFVLSIFEVKHDPAGAFYLVPFRAWELLLGSLLALGAVPKFGGVRFRNALSALGLISILISLFVYSPSTPFPGLAAALPCLGAGLIIYGNESGRTITGTLLATRPMVAIGLISYSLYLWHWFLLVFSEQLLGRPLKVSETIGAVLLSFALAAFSWKFVERPFRKHTLGNLRPALFLEVGLVTACVAVAAVVGIAKHGLPQRYSAQVSQYEAGRTDLDNELFSCTSNLSLARVQHDDMCRLGSKTAKPDFIVWGDSHAGSIAPAFKELARETSTTGWVASSPGCAPLLAVVRVDPRISGCPEFNDAVISTIERYDIPVVVLAGRWDISALGRSRWELSEGLPQIFLVDAQSRQTSLVESRAVFERGLGRTLARLKQGNRKVILLMDVPNTSMDTPLFLARSTSRGLIGQDARTNITAYKGQQEFVDDLLRRLGVEWGVTIINPKSFLCSGLSCLIAKDGRSLYRDDHHLTLFGALQLVDLLRPGFERLVPSRSG
jgi:peptidoglycan/LPS O-acetylase OafA/YrhL